MMRELKMESIISQSHMNHNSLSVKVRTSIFQTRVFCRLLFVISHRKRRVHAGFHTKLTRVMKSLIDLDDLGFPLHQTDTNTSFWHYHFFFWLNLMANLSFKVHKVRTHDASCFCKCSGLQVFELSTSHFLSLSFFMQQYLWKITSIDG